MKTNFMNRFIYQRLWLAGATVLLLAPPAELPAQSTWNYFISDAGDGNSLVTWTVSGSLASASGASWMSSGPLQAVPISVPGIFADSYVADGTPQDLPAPDGSSFFDLGWDIPITGFYSYNAAGGSDDGFGLMVSLSGTRAGDRLVYVPGTQSALIPVDYSNFNPGTYQSLMPQFNPAVTVNLTVGPVPEPGTLALASVGTLAGWRLFRDRQIAFRRRRIK